MNTVNLFGIDDIKVNNADSKKILQKANNPKTVTVSASKSIKSKKLSIPEKLNIINDNVNNTLGIYYFHQIYYH